MLYGADPMPLDGGQLRPVMTLESRVIAVREIAAGEPLGYGARFVAERPTRVGLVAMGYADGYPRVVPTGTPVAVDGKPGRIIGRVSMDMLTVDLSGLADAGLGSRVELWARRCRSTRLPPLPARFPTNCCATSSARGSSIAASEPGSGGAGSR